MLFFPILDAEKKEIIEELRNAEQSKNLHGTDNIKLQHKLLT